MDWNFGPREQILWPVTIFSGIIMCKIVSVSPNFGVVFQFFEIDNVLNH